ncbi:MAG: GNAT family N-acetyltransferase [Burkholderiaceae bacterium]|nr:GNAT family N-acetyltransferase [Burkholderiaceae bacterium]
MTASPSPANAVTFRQAAAGDAEELLKLQYLCYQPEAELYGHGIQPLTQPLHEVAAEIEGGPAFVAEQGGFIVGGVRCRFEGDVMHLGKLICHPRVQRQGIGARLMALAEQCARQRPSVKAVVLFTGARSAATVRRTPCRRILCGCARNLYGRNPSCGPAAVTET